MPRRLPTLGRLSCTLATVAMTASALAWILLGTGYAPLRYGSAGVLLIGATASLLIGRVADNWPARLLRTLGYAPILAEGALITHSLAGASGLDQLREKTSHGLPIFGTALVCLTVALAAATSRRAATDPRTLAVCGGVTALTAVVSLVPVLLSPPLPATPGWALLAVLGAGVAAFLLTLTWLDDPRQAAVAALGTTLLVALLCAAASENLLLFTTHWVPDTSPPNVPAADRLLNNRLGAEDPYLQLLLLSLLSALALAALTLRIRLPRLGSRRTRATGRPAVGTAE